MGKLLFDEQPLVVSATLAVKIGLEEAMIIQQIHYWVEINTKADRNYKEGFYWTFNTIEDWQKQFPFWSTRTIRRALKNLENMNLIITGRFNKLSLDRTKWYRINYPQLDLLENENKQKVNTPCGQTGHLEADRLSAPIPETNLPETTTENNDNGATSRSALPSQNINDVDNSNIGIIQQAVAYYLSAYEKEFKEEHPKLKKAQWSRIRGVLSYFANENALDYDSFATMIDRHFERRMDTDYNINHFATEGVLQNLFWEVLY